MSTMASLWDIGKSTEEKLAEQWKEDDKFDEKVDLHKHKFRERFEQNMDDDVPTHPYKLFRQIVENNELNDEERVALEHIKEQYSDEWQNLKNSQSN